MRLSHFSLCLLTAAICTQLYAEDTATNDSTTQNTEAKLPTIVMTATRTPKSISEIAGTVQTISADQIAQQAGPGRKVADVLAQLVPSLAPSSGTSSNYGQTMRGRNVLVMIDGVSQTGSRDVSRQLNSISPNMIDHIEVVSGATSIYGSGATGGIINIITKRGGQDPISFESKVGVTAGNNFKSDAMAYEASQSVLFNQGALQGAFGASYTTRGEIQDSHGNRIGPEVAQTDRQDTDTLDLNGRLTWNISDEQSLSFGAQYFKDEQDSEYGPDYGPNLAYVKRDPTYTASLAAVKGMQLETQPQTERYAFNTQYENQNVLGHTLNAEAYYRNEQARWFPSAQAMGGGLYLVYQSETDIDVYGARVALQKQFDLNGRNLGLSYGIDYENEQDEQNIQMYDSAAFVASNGLNYKPFNYYAFGPDVETEKLGTFVQTDFDVTDRLGLKAGVRYERVESQVDESTPYMEAITADLQPGYQTKTLNGGKVKHDATLFNLGALYHLTDAQQVFANFSQGSNLPDIQRMLRDVPASFTVNSQTIDPIKVNNYELGWRVQAENGLNASVTTFYNDSDKSLKFGRPNYTIEVLDTDERVYGVEGNLSYRLQPNWTVGGTMAYTRGQFKNTAGKWQELDAIRVAPLKGTAFSEWQFNNDMSLRVQALAIGGTDKAKKDAVKYGSTVPAEIKGFATMDVIANAKAGPGTVGFGVYNVWNTDYKSVYSQAVESVYGAISSLPAQGRTYGLSYTLKY